MNPLESPLFGLVLTFALYLAAQKLYSIRPIFLFSPVLVAITAIIVILKYSGLPYETYNRGGRLISFFLGPAVVALGVPLYEKLPEIRKRATAITVSIISGSAVGILSAALTAKLLGAPPEVVASLAPKSVTTPIAIGIAGKLGGIEPLTAGLVIATGMLGAVAGPAILDLIGVKSAVPRGLAMGAASHGIGTARAMEEGELQGATSGLAIGLNGIATAVLTPLLMALIL